MKRKTFGLICFFNQILAAPDETVSEPQESETLLFTVQEDEHVSNNEEVMVDDPNDPTYNVEEDNFSESKKAKSKSQVCHVCNATFARVNHLTRHMILHRNVLVHRCDRCDKVGL